MCTTRYLIFSMIIKFFLFSLTLGLLRALELTMNLLPVLVERPMPVIEGTLNVSPQKKRDTKQKTRNIFDIFFAVFVEKSLLQKYALSLRGTGIPSFIPYVCLRPKHAKNRTSELTESCQRINDVPGSQNKRVKCLSGNRKSSPKRPENDAERLKKY